MHKMFVTLFLIAWSTASMSHNPIRNPGFEDGTDSPSHWLFWTRATGQGKWDDEVAHTGKRSVRIVGSEGNDNWSQRDIPIQPNSLYRFRVWVKQRGCYPWPPDVVLTAYDGDRRALQSWQFRGRPGTREWYLLEGLFVPPANAVSVNVELRMLLLAGTVWFDDVSIERIGKWTEKPQTKDPTVEAEQKYRYLRRLSTEVPTPHRKWTSILWQPVRVFFAIDRLSQREIVELHQRFALPWHTVFFTSEPIAKYMTGEYYEQLYPEELRAAYRRALEEPFDVIVLSGSVWDGFEERERTLTLQKVEQGATLVYFGKPLAVQPDDPLCRALGIHWTDKEVTASPIGESPLLCAYPDLLPPFSLHVADVTEGNVLVEAQGEDGNRYPLIVEHRFGAGRTLLVTYRSEMNTAEVRGSGMTPVFPRGAVANLTFDYHEYLLASVMRWILYAAQPDRWRVQNIRAERTKEGIRAVMQFPAPNRTLHARCRWYDAFSRHLATAEYTLQPSDTQLAVPFEPHKTPPAGNLFLEVAVVDGDALVDCAVVSIPSGEVKLEVQLDNPVAPRGGELTGMARLSGLPAERGRTYRLLLRLQDCYGWEWENHVRPVRTDAGMAAVRFSISLARMRASGGQLIVAVEDAEHNVLAERRVEVIQAADNRWDDWHQVLWTVFGRSGYRTYLWKTMAKRLREMGIDTWLFNVQGEEWRTAARYDFYTVPIGIYGVFSTAEGFNAYAKTGDKQHLQRKPVCPNTPEERANAERTIRNAIDLMGTYQPLAYCLSDENNLTYYNAPFDLCICPSCLAGFREWLRGRYGSLQRLNQVWRRDYGAWEQVMPDTFEEAKARGIWTSWADHREYMDSVFVDVWQRVRQAAKGRDPNAKIAISGTPEPYAYGGYDWYPLAQNFDVFFSYTDYFAEHITRAPWSAGYGAVGANLSFSIWNAAFRGCRGIGVFWLPSMLEPDLTFSTSAQHLEQFSRPLRQGLGKLLIHASPARPQVAIYHSMPSLRAAFALGIDEELTAQREALFTLLRSAGVAFSLVDARQVEQGWLLQNKPRLLILSAALAMSDREISALRTYVQRGGRVLVLLTPALFDEKLTPRQALPLDDLIGSMERHIPPAPQLTELPNMPLPSRHRVLHLQRMPLATYLRDINWRACAEMEAHCRQREEWIHRVLRWAGVTGSFSATRPDGERVQDCVWAEWSLGKGAKLVGMLRQASALGTQPIRLRAGKASTVIDVLKGEIWSADMVEFALQPGEAKLLALLPHAPGSPQVRVLSGEWRRGQTVRLTLQVPNAPSLSAARVEIRDAHGEPLPALSQNLLLKEGKASCIIDLPLNLPHHTRLVVRHVLTGEELTLNLAE